MNESVRVWRSSVDDMIALIEPLDEEQWALATPCPGWSVADVVAHIIDLDSHFLGDPRPDHEPEWSELPHVTSDMQRFIEIGVDGRRSRTPSQLLAELREVADRRYGQLQDADLQQTVQWFVGEVTIERLLWMRAFDVWTHEQDIRAAIGQPGGLDSAGAQVAWARIRDTLPFIWGKKVGTSKTLELIVTPPGPSGRLMLAVDGGRADYVDSGDPDVTVTITWADLAARGAGRIAADHVSATITGDEHLGRAFLEELAFTP